MDIPTMVPSELLASETPDTPLATNTVLYWENSESSATGPTRSAAGKERT